MLPVPQTPSPVAVTAPIIQCEWRHANTLTAVYRIEQRVANIATIVVGNYQLDMHYLHILHI